MTTPTTQPPAAHLHPASAGRFGGQPKPRPTPFVYLSRVHALQASGNAAIAIALANSLFFSIDPNAARSSVIAYLLLSVTPFVLVAPMIGPAIDKVRSGQKAVLILLLLAMGLASFGMIGRTQTLFVFPLAFGVLVFGKGYAIGKAAIMPLVVRSDKELVPKNSRLAVLTGVMSFVGALPAALASLVGGPSWPVGLAMIQFLAAAILAFRLPSSDSWKRGFSDSAVNGAGGWGNFAASAQPEREDLLSDWNYLQSAGEPGTASVAAPAATGAPVAQVTAGAPPTQVAAGAPVAQTAAPLAAAQTGNPSRSWWYKIFGIVRLWRSATQNPSLDLPSIKNSALAMLVLRGCVGFMTFFLAFHFRGGTDDVDLSGVGTAVGAGVSNLIGFDVNSQDAEPIWKLGILVAFGVGGGLVGSFSAPKLRRANQEYQILVGSLLFVGVASLGAWFIGGLLGGVLVAFAVGFAGGAGRIAFDSIVQRDAGDKEYGRSFALFETRFQLIWVIGALLPVLFKVPFSLGCILLLAVAAAELIVYLASKKTNPVAT